MSIAELYNIKRAVRSDREAAIFDRQQTPSRSPARLCNICYATGARYTCPGCNVPYCSVPCFRSEQHSSCAVRFAAQSQHDDEDEGQRDKVLDILRRLEDPHLVESDSDGQDDSESGAALDLDVEAASEEQLLAALTPAERDRFQRAINDPAEAQKLFASLDAKARKLDSDDSGTQQLISVPPKQHERQPQTTKWQETPWWETSQPAPAACLDSRGRPSDVQAFTQTVQQLLKSNPSDTDLFFNLLCVLLAYVYVIRHLDTQSLSQLVDPLLPSTDSLSLTDHGSDQHDDQSEDEMPPLEPDDPQDGDRASQEASGSDESNQHRPQADTIQDRDRLRYALSKLDDLLPFLTLVQSKRTKAALSHSHHDLSRLLLSSTKEATQWIASHLQPSEMGTSAASLLLHLLCHVQTLFQPEKIVLESDSSPRYRVASHISPDAYRYSLALNAIFDMHYFFQHASVLQDQVQDKCNAAMRKLAFYAARALLRNQPIPFEARIQRDIANEIDRLQTEINDAERQSRFDAAARVMADDSIDIRTS